MPPPMNHHVHHETTYPPYEPPKTEAGWNTGRSMSYSHLEEAHPHEPYNQYYNPESRRNTTDMLPPSLRHSGSSSIVSMSEGSQNAIAGVTPVQTMPSPGLPVTWQHSMPTQSPKSMSYNGPGWGYPDPSHLAKVSEEQEVAPHYVEDNHILYSGPHQ